MSISLNFQEFLGIDAGQIKHCRRISENFGDLSSLRILYLQLFYEHIGFAVMFESEMKIQFKLILMRSR